VSRIPKHTAELAKNHRLRYLFRIFCPIFNQSPGELLTPQVSSNGSIIPNTHLKRKFTGFYSSNQYQFPFPDDRQRS